MPTNSSRVSRKDSDSPTFTILFAVRGCEVRITWPDGEEGPTIAFASRADAELWVKRDAGRWLDRLAALSPPSRLD